MLLTNPFRPDPRVYQEAKALVSDGHDVTILCWDREGNYPSEEVIDGIKITRLFIPSRYGVVSDFIPGILKFYIKSIKYAKNIKWDVIHAHDLDTLPLAVILSKLGGGKIVYDVHDHYTSMIEDVVSPKISRIIRYFEKVMIKQTDARIAATNDLGMEIFKNMRYVVVMNAKDLKEYNIPEETVWKFRKEINPEDKFLIVYIGILKMWTSLPQIIDAVKDMKDVLLLIGGDGPHKAEILKKIKDAENIRYLGWIKRESIPLYTKASDIIILISNPDKDYTRVAVPNKIMEALASGKPIIAGEGTAGGRIVKECNAGLLCRFGDVKCIQKRIRYLMENVDACQEFGKNARKCAEKKYNWEVMSERLLNLYSSL